MKVLSKKSFVVLLSLITMLMFAVSAMFVAGNVKASEGETTPPPAITMVKGASARVGGDEVNGLRFIAGMPNEDYGWFAKNVGEDKTYASVKFGMFIAPADYVSVTGKEFTEANLFGESAIYTWATFKDDAWDETTVDANKVRIINIVADKMTTYIDNPDLMVVTGAIKDYQEQNIVRDFVGRGYYQLFDGAGNVVKTELATYAENNVDNNTRSMIEVVQSSIENEVLDEEQIKSAKETYFDEIADNVKPMNDKIDVLLDKTVAGNDNSTKTAIDVTTVVYTSATGKETEFKLNSWGTQAVALNVTDGVVTAKDVCGGSLVVSTYLGLTIKVNAYMPISSRADLDALGFDYYEDGNASKWTTGYRYMLTNDIDYATDTSVYTYTSKDGESKTFRMDDGNGVQDLWDRYLIPIAASRSDSNVNNAFNGQKICQTEWGIFGKLSGETSGDYTFFNAVIDGAGYAIKNAVIPYGVSFAYEPTQSGVNSNHGSNFIGTLVYGGQLRNIAFTGLEFEDPSQIGSVAGQNPYYTDKNTNLTNSILKTKGYITNTGIKNGNFAHQYFNPSNRTGLVGLMQNGIISNVYVEAVMKNGTFSTRAVNGLVVAWIDKDVDNYTTKGLVENCIVKTSYSSSASWINYLIDYTGTQTTFTTLHDYNSGMGAVVGTSFLTEANVIKNCFVIGNMQVYTLNESNKNMNYCDANPLNTIFAPGTERHSDSKGFDLSTNCGVYSSVSALKDAQAQALANMSIAKYLG